MHSSGPRHRDVTVSRLYVWVLRRSVHNGHRPSVTLPGHACTASAYKKIQISAAIGLQHMVVIELIITASKDRVRRLPLRATALDLSVGDIQMKPPLGHVQFDRVPSPDQPQNSAGCRLR